MIDQLKKLLEDHGNIYLTEPELANACVTNCMYRKFCPEFESCGGWDRLNG